MSSDTIIEGLKQGNGVELGVLQNLKEGLNTVVDGMINQCLSRSDGLAELTENLSLGSSSEAATDLTAEDEIKLAKIIEDAMRFCEREIDFNTGTKKVELARTSIGFKAQQGVLDMLLTHIKAHEDALDQRAALQDKSQDVVDWSPYDALQLRECAFLDKLLAFHRDAARELRERKKSCYDRIEDQHGWAQGTLQMQMAALLRIAEAAKIDLEVVRDLDEQSLQEA
ncbi:hypothetical protein J4E83_005724 [Alternaria metachromatica]|uniref:uncharacterized protein n=1 Tax=Alternaria metachromatica TaxID=283354 RepID=UPI0020C21CA7|nr:uncharacterized protein J4E83_005724 [Alternaria metachromatica]KAI4619867.1 hypothetical protein J4E83_005724 [Alternaria metachromatica]